MYPTEDAPYYGIFVKEQKMAVCRFHNDVDYTVVFIDGRKDKLTYLKSINKIHKIINENEFDLIHVHYGFAGLFLLKKLKKNIPILITLHGGDIQIEQGKKIQVFFTKRILKRANAAVTLNERMDKIVRDYVKKTYIVPCSVNTDIFSPGKQRKNQSEEDIKIVFPSDKTRFVKNYPLFEKVIAVLIERYNIDCRTFEVKNMSRAQVSELYRSSDIMILTSFSEGSPQVVKEAMACNLPVVSTNVGDVSFLLDGVKDSAVSNTMSEIELAELAFDVLNNRIDGIDGRKKIFQLGLDDKSISDKLYSIYKKLIDG